MMRLAITLRIFRLFRMLSSAVKGVPGVRDGLALPVEVLQDAHTEFLSLQQGLLALPDVISGPVDPVRRLQEALSLRGRGGGPAIPHQPKLGAVGQVRVRARRLLRVALQLAQVRLVLPELAKQRVLLVRREAPRLQVHAPDQRIRLGQVVRDVPRLLVPRVSRKGPELIYLSSQLRREVAVLALVPVEYRTHPVAHTHTHTHTRLA